ncbi:MAG: T9SS type A sorting domain-containing protein, partial [Candidatus Cloacimonadota bacterium]|nr:T9SS type A sorting domain-containing protein [Candidatus Cloacimonadota bacterium]
KKYEPISYIDTLHTENSAIFIQDENANVYKITANGYEKIFTATTWGKQASQLSLSNLTNNSQIYLGFGIGNRAFAITPDGSLLEGFPAYLENAIIATESYPEIIKNNNSNIILFATENNGVIALDSSGKIHPEMSFGNSNYAKNHIFYWDKPNKYFYYFHQDSDNTLYVSFKEFVAEDPVIWEGFRNNIYGSFQGAINIPIIEEKEMKAYAFPNPAKNGEFRLKVQNAKADIDIKIFDIAGNKIYSENIEKTPGNIRDIRFSTKKLSSGVYFAVIKSRGETKKVPIAIIK